MADNDRFVIQKVEKTKCAECKFKKYEICERDENEFMLCPITNKTVSETVKKHRGKTRADCEIEIAELIYKDVEEIVLETINETIKWKPSEYFKKAKSISKKTVDRLFGEGE